MFLIEYASNRCQISNNKYLRHINYEFKYDAFFSLSLIRNSKIENSDTKKLFVLILAKLLCKTIKDRCLLSPI